MKKLKKLSKNKKPAVIFLYGPVAVGKLTVAKVLSKKLGYKLTHNHQVNDFVEEMFGRGSYTSNSMKEYMRFGVLEHTVMANTNFVTTHCYRHNYVSQTGLTDPQYVRALQKRLVKLGAKFYPIHLKATDKELLRRVNMESRKKFRKLVSKKIMKEYLKVLDFKTLPGLRNNFVVDNTKLSPNKVADVIIKHFKIKLSQ